MAIVWTCVGDAELYDDDEDDDDNEDDDDLSGGSGHDIDNLPSPQHVDSIRHPRRRLPPSAPRNPPPNVNPNRHFVNPSLRRRRPVVYTAPTITGPVIYATTTTLAADVYYNTRRSNYYHSGSSSSSNAAASMSRVVVVSSALLSSFVVLCRTFYIDLS